MSNVVEFYEIPPKFENLANGMVRIFFDYQELSRETTEITDHLEPNEEPINTTGRPITQKYFLVQYVDVQYINYKAIVEAIIRLKYDVSDELAILRQQNEKAEQYQEYYQYAEYAKDKASVYK